MLITIFTVTTAMPVYALSPGDNGRGVPDIGEQYFHSDHLGNNALITDGEGVATSNVLYDSYGKILKDSKGKDNFRDKWSRACLLYTSPSPRD